MFTAETPEASFGTGDFKIYLEPTEVETDFGTTSITYRMALAIFSQQPNILAGGGYLVVIPLEAAETIGAAVTRTDGLVQYFGVMNAAIDSQTDILAAAAVVQALNKIYFTVSRTEADVDPAGTLDQLRTGNFDQSRGLFYGADNDNDALIMMASYVGRALSTNFNGANTTQTMHLKDLIGVQPDTSMTQTILQKCITAGVDTYISIQGVSKVFTSGENGFFDDVYNLQWLVGALQVGSMFLQQFLQKFLKVKMVYP